MIVMTYATLQKAVLVGFVAFLLLPSLAASAEQGTNVITEAAAIERGLEKSAELNKANAQVLARKKVADFSRFEVDNPELRFRDLSTKYFDSSVDNQEFQIGLRWRLPRIGELSEKQAESQVDLWEERVDAFDLKMDVISDIRETYAELVLLQSLTELTQRKQELEERRNEIVSKFCELGSRSLGNRMKARRRFVKAKREAMGIAGRYSETKKHFARLVGVSENVTVIESEPVELVLDDETLQTVAFSNRPEAELSKRRMALAQSRYRAERFKLIPWFSFVEANYHYESQKTDWGELVLGIEVPLFNWNLGKLRSTKIERNNLSLFHEAEQTKVDRDLSKAMVKYRQAFGEYQALKQEAQVSLGEMEQLIQQAKSQQLPQDEILDLEISDIEMKIMLKEAVYDVTIEAINVSTIVGVQSERSLTK